MSFRIFAAASVLPAWSAGEPAATPVEVRGPDGSVRFELAAGEHLTYTIRMEDQPVIEPWPLGIIVDGVDLGRGAELGKVGA